MNVGNAGLHSLPELFIFYKHQYKMYNGPHRKNMRLREYNYSDDGFYFVTFCTKNRENCFGEIIDGKMILNDYGKIAELEIIKTGEIRGEINIIEFIIMPNHVHLIIEIKIGNEIVGNAGLRSLQTGINLPNPKQTMNDFTKNYLSNSIQRIKSSLTREIRKQYNDYNFSWQRSFYDKIIRGEDELNKTRQYILDNPMNWEFDKNNI